MAFVQDKLIVTDYYISDKVYTEYLPKLVGLYIIDIITKINVQKVEGIVSQNLQFYSASNKTARLRDISLGLIRHNQKSMPVEVIKTKLQ